jgi:hypothetical protein
MLHCGEMSDYSDIRDGRMVRTTVMIKCCVGKIIAVVDIVGAANDAITNGGRECDPGGSTEG